MFKKPATVKTTSPLRSSDLRKLREELAATFSLPLALAKRILADGLLVTSARTHLDEAFSFYSDPSRAEGSKDHPILLVRRDKELLPSIYLLDLVPTLLSARVRTVTPVLEHLISGAALFTQGVQCEFAMLPPEAQAGDLTSVLTLKSDRVEAVGYLTASKEDLLRYNGGKGVDEGKAVITLHARGDWLWHAGGERALAPIPLEDGVKLGGLTPEEAPTETVEVQEEPGDARDAPLSPEDVDVILRNALLLLIKRNPPTEFPLPASAVYSSLLPLRPHFVTPALCDIKKSSFKKIAPLMKVASKAGLLVTKEIKGELMVMSINAEHPDVGTVRSYKTLADLAKRHASAVAVADAPSTSSNSTVLLFLRPSRELQSSGLFPSAAEDTDMSLYTLHDVKTQLTNYIASHRLQHPREGKYFVLDETLGLLLLKPGEQVEFMTKEDAMERLEKQCEAWYRMTVGGKSSLKKGTLPHISIKTKPVGKRVVTLVSGYEAWDVNAQELADELRHLAASSASVQPLQGCSPKKPLTEVLIQGSIEALVEKVLVARGVPRAYLRRDTVKKPSK